MTPVEQRLTIVANTLANIADRAISLKAQLFELDKLRELVQEALLSAEHSGPLHADRKAM